MEGGWRDVEHFEGVRRGFGLEKCWDGNGSRGLEEVMFDV
jgi:hypothetical protein